MTAKLFIYVQSKCYISHIFFSNMKNFSGPAMIYNRGGQLLKPAGRIWEDKVLPGPDC